MKFEKSFNIFYDEDMKVPMKLWLSELEDGAYQQFYNMARLPFAYHHVAGMPDAHYGYGMPIGGVLATKGYIIPNAVGKDIGCGMIALKTPLFVGSLDKAILKKIMTDIRKLIPIGTGGKHKKSIGTMPKWGSVDFVNTISFKEYDNAEKQIGTLGSGNHFIEIQAGDDGYIWIMIHSGSRNLGNQICNHYNKIARELNEKWFSQIPTSWGLSFLPFDSEIGQTYFYEMAYACEYAYINRLVMMEKVKEAILNHVNVSFELEDAPLLPHSSMPLINIHHNYAAIENHFGQNVLVHRKGATRAYENEIGIIPGSQGTCSYIVKGKGNPDSFKSCSHGSGRTMSRTKAKEDLDLKNEIERLDKMGVVHAIRSKKDLEEAPSAYKDIEDVMLHQKDLVDIVVELKPLCVVKG